jgi:hypothetical protein
VTQDADYAERSRLFGAPPKVIWLRCRKQARRLGVSEAELLRSYPGLSAQDLSNAWNYVRAHRREIEEAIAANETAEA